MQLADASPPSVLFVSYFLTFSLIYQYFHVWIFKTFALKINSFKPKRGVSVRETVYCFRSTRSRTESVPSGPPSTQTIFLTLILKLLRVIRSVARGAIGVTRSEKMWKPPRRGNWPPFVSSIRRSGHRTFNARKLRKTSFRGRLTITYNYFHFARAKSRFGISGESTAKRTGRIENERFAIEWDLVQTGGKNFLVERAWLRRDAWNFLAAPFVFVPGGSGGSNIEPAPSDLCWRPRDRDRRDYRGGWPLFTDLRSGSELWSVRVVYFKAVSLSRDTRCACGCVTWSVDLARTETPLIHHRLELSLSLTDFAIGN